MPEKISIIGSGVVGKATGIGFHKHDHEVIFYDINKEILVSIRKKGYETAGSLAEAISNSSISFVCVQTPLMNGRMNFGYVERAIVDIAHVLRKKRDYHLIVIRSTVLPTTTRTKIIPLLEQFSDLRVGEDFGVCMNPEFLRAASALQDFLNPSRIVIGELEKRSGDLLETLYTSFGAPIVRVDLDTAEAIKYVANLFLSTKISFFNEIYIACKKLGLQPHIISEAVALDPRIGNYGIYGGRPFQGECLPKDLQGFISFLEDRGVNPELLNAVLNVNKKIAKIASEKP